MFFKSQLITDACLTKYKDKTKEEIIYLIVCIYVCIYVYMCVLICMKLNMFVYEHKFLGVYVWLYMTCSPTLEAESHQPRKTSTPD